MLVWVMDMKHWKSYIFWIALTEGVGALAGWLTRDGVKQFEAAVTQPALSPPSWVFPVVWGILYALMGIGAARIWLTPEKQGLNLFLTQLTVNFFWPLLFFNTKAYGFAALWLGLLWVLVLLMILAFRKADRVAAWLQIPYLLWLTFALYLNIGIWYLNRGI